MFLLYFPEVHDLPLFFFEVQTTLQSCKSVPVKIRGKLCRAYAENTQMAPHHTQHKSQIPF